MQELQFAAERSGVAVGQIEKGLIKLAIAVDEVRTGEITEIGKALLRLGGGLEEAILNGASLAELIPIIADRFKAMEDPITKATIASDVFGTRIGSNLIPLFDEGSIGLAILAEEFSKFGFITEETAKKAEAFVDAQTNLEKSMLSLKSFIAAELMPQITVMINGLAGWIAKNKELMGQKVKGWVEAVEITVDNLGTAFNFLSTDIKGVKSEFFSLGGAILAFNESILLAIKGIALFQKGKALEFKISAFTPGSPLFLQFDKANELQKQAQAELAKTEKAIEDMEQANLKLAMSVNGTNIALAKERDELEDNKEALENVKPPLEKLIGDDGEGLRGLSDAAEEAEKALEAFEAAQESFIQTLDDQIASIQKEIDLFNASAEAVIAYEINQLKAQLANEGFNESILKKIDLLEKERLALLNLEQVKLFEEEEQQALEDALEERQQAIEDSLQGIQIFAATVAANINTAFADTLTELIFDFKNFGDAIKNVLKSILNAFFQMIATIATNPIRIGLEGALGGGGGVGGATGGIGGLVGGGLKGLGSSFGALGGLFGIGGGATAIPAALPGVNSLLGIGASSTGLIAGLGAALPAIGAVLAVAAIAIPLIMKAFEKTPRLDIDIGVIRNEMGKRAALIGEFLDPALIDDVINISVKRKAGLGVGGDKIKQLISDSIVGAIESIQAIIAQLPQDMFLALNEALLSAEIDIESKIKGDRLLEFDETKKIAQRFQQFLEGDLPTRVFASIRNSFFAPMLESLGVATDAVAVMMDDFLASLQGATREERIILGQEFLATIDAYVDVFNILNDGMKGVIAQAISDVTALATSLDIQSARGIPTLREIEAALQDLFETGQLTAEVAQDFMALRAAVISLTVGLSQSISNITAIIARLDSDIVGLGGSAIGTSAGIESAIDSLQGLLDNEALSLDEREAILRELNSLADQLGATELANQRQAIQANAAAANSRIQNLQRLKTVEADKNQAALDALNKELNLVEALESLVEGIRRNISTLLLAPGGPESSAQRIARARGGVENLFNQLASASPEQQVEIAGQIQDLLNELNTLRQEAFQAPSAESDALFREIVLNLEKLEGLIEPARSSEEIQASIETIELASQAFLSSIDSRIVSFQSKLTSLQSTGNQLTGAVANRIRELKEAIRAEFVLILEERLKQLSEVSEVGLGDIVEIEAEMLITLRSIDGTLSNLAGFKHGGFVPPGVDMIAMLHGGSQGEDITPRNGNSPQGGNVYLTLPPMTFSAGQVVNPKMFMSELMKSLHDRRVTDEIVKVTRGKK